jgi:predicted nucleic acid-binding protein
VLLLLLDTNIYDALYEDSELFTLLEFAVLSNKVRVLGTAINSAELNAISDKKSHKYISIKQNLLKLNIQEISVQGFIVGESQLETSVLLSWRENDDLISIIGESGQSYRDSLLIKTAKFAGAKFVTNDENARKRAILHDVKGISSNELMIWLKSTELD